MQVRVDHVADGLVRDLLDLRHHAVVVVRELVVDQHYAGVGHDHGHVARHAVADHVDVVSDLHGRELGRAEASLSEGRSGRREQRDKRRGRGRAVQHRRSAPPRGSSSGRLKLTSIRPRTPNRRTLLEKRLGPLKIALMERRERQVAECQLRVPIASHPTSQRQAFRRHCLRSTVVRLRHQRGPQAHEREGRASLVAE